MYAIVDLDILHLYPWCSRYTLFMSLFSRFTLFYVLVVLDIHCLVLVIKDILYLWPICSRYTILMMFLYGGLARESAWLMSSAPFGRLIEWIFLNTRQYFTILMSFVFWISILWDLISGVQWLAWAIDSSPHPQYATGPNPYHPVSIPPSICSM